MNERMNEGMSCEGRIGISGIDLGFVTCLCMGQGGLVGCLLAWLLGWWVEEKAIFRISSFPLLVDGRGGGEQKNMLACTYH